MRLKEEFHNEEALEKFGFKYQAEEEEEDFYGQMRKVDFELANRFIFHIGWSRRGQSYFITILPNTRELFVYVRGGDGLGTHIPLGNMLLEMIKKDMVEA